MTNFISRRDLLKRAGLVGAAVMVSPEALRPAGATSPAIAGQLTSPPSRPPLETLSATEAEILDAFVARLIPSDANGAGALEAGAMRYIDRALGGALAASREAYRTGLAALDQHTRTTRGKPFIALPPAEQDAVLIDMEAGRVTGFPAGSAAFFALVRTHTIQGTFCDPFYGGNANFTGWDLIGYPGVRTIVTADDQRLGAEVPRNHKSAYDYETFTKASAKLAADHEPHHGE